LNLREAESSDYLSNEGNVDLEVTPGIILGVNQIKEVEKSEEGYEGKQNE